MLHASVISQGVYVMFKLLVLLCGGLFLTMQVGGRDNGQLRFGLMPQPAPKQVLQVTAAATPPAPKTPVTAASFVPAEPIMAQIVTEPAPALVPETAASIGRILQVNSKTANVRSGPGKDFEVVGRLARGEAVSVVIEGEGPDGWSLVRIEGDGVEGYIAARLLSE